MSDDLACFFFSFICLSLAHLRPLVYPASLNLMPLRHRRGLRLLALSFSRRCCGAKQFTGHVILFCKHPAHRHNYYLSSYRELFRAARRVVRRSLRAVRCLCSAQRRHPCSRVAPLSGRRALLVGGLSVAVFGFAAYWLIRRKLFDLATFQYDDLQYLGTDVQPIMPNNRFYTVTKSVIDPRVNRSLWRLEVTGRLCASDAEQITPKLF